MDTTVSVHWNKGNVVRLHNQRDEEFCRRESHIDLYNEHGNSVYENLVKTDLKTAYETVFGNAINEYNAKQKRADRKITVDDYMQSVVNDNRGNRQTKRVNGKKVIDEDASRRGKQLSYEFTVKVGNVEEKAHDSEGAVLYDNNNHHIRLQELPRDITYNSIKRYINTFQEVNPALIMINADYHGDEGFFNKQNVWEYSTDHGHIEVIPVATGFAKGLSIQNSMNKAMAAMGFTGSDCYEQWAKKEQSRLEDIVIEEYNKYCDLHPEYAKQHGKLSIIHPVHDKNKQGDMTKEQIAKQQELDEREREINIQESDLERVLDNIENKQLCQDKRDKEQDMRENALNDRERVLDEKAYKLSLKQKKLEEEEIRQSEERKKIERDKMNARQEYIDKYNEFVKTINNKYTRTGRAVPELIREAERAYDISHSDDMSQIEL